MEDLQEIQSQITSYSAKLQLLQKTHDIEEKEAERLTRNVAKRNDTYKKKIANDYASIQAEQECALRREEQTRRDFVSKMTRDEYVGQESFLAPVTNVLSNFEGSI